MTVTYIYPDAKGITYPYLQGFVPDWYIVSRKLDSFSTAAKRRILSGNVSSLLDLEETAADIGVTSFHPTLAWVKDNKLVTLYSMFETDEFLERTGLVFSMENGPMKLCKRISRIMRPFRFYQFENPDAIDIRFSDMDEQLHDGLGFVSKAYLQRRFPKLAHYRRFEITLLHEHGQEKGHVIVLDDLHVDFLFPTSGRKPEVRTTRSVFVGLEPVKGKDHMHIDIQSLVNLYPFFPLDKLENWLEDESASFIEAIESGQVEEVLGNLDIFDNPGSLAAWQRWWLGEYLASGGQLKWFPGTIRAFGNQQIKRIKRYMRDYRSPAPGYRLYIAPDVVNDTVEPGHARIDMANATLWVNTQDWKDWVAEILGGADCDDAVWCVAFADTAQNGRSCVLVWRSPNQFGEFALLQLGDDWHSEAMPMLCSDDLPPRIDEQNIQYGQLQPFRDAGNVTDYSVDAMLPGLANAFRNQFVLGAYCNMLLSCVAVFGRVPQVLPARLEDVIDATVKSPLDLQPVTRWIKQARRQLLRSANVPEQVQDRLKGGNLDPDHWLENFRINLRTHLSRYKESLAICADSPRTPIRVFDSGASWEELGNNLLHIFASGIGRNEPIQEVTAACYDFAMTVGGDLARWMMLGAASKALGNGRSDAVLWQEADEDSLARLTMAGLRAIGLLGEPVWTLQGAQLWYDEQPATAVPVGINGVWYNGWKVQTADALPMGEMDRRDIGWAKERIAELAPSWSGMKLTLQRKGDRLVAISPHGNLVGYIGRQYEYLLDGLQTAVIYRAAVRDGNLIALLQLDS